MAKVRDPKTISYLTRVLSDTSSAKGYYIVLAIKTESADTTRLFIAQNISLFNYFKRHYNWSGRKYMSVLMNHLLNKTPLTVKDDTYFNATHLTRFEKCLALRGENPEALIGQFKTTDRFAPEYPCIMAGLFYHNILMVQVEEQILIER